MSEPESTEARDTILDQLDAIRESVEQRPTHYVLNETIRQLRGVIEFLDGDPE